MSLIKILKKNNKKKKILLLGDNVKTKYLLYYSIIVNGYIT